MSQVDDYTQLGLTPQASDEEVKRAWRKQAQQWHPDHNLGNPHAKDEFRLRQTAYENICEERANGATLDSSENNERSDAQHEKQSYYDFIDESHNAEQYFQETYPVLFAHINQISRVELFKRPTVLAIGGAVVTGFLFPAFALYGVIIIALGTVAIVGSHTLKETQHFLGVLHTYKRKRDDKYKHIYILRRTDKLLNELAEDSSHDYICDEVLKRLQLALEGHDIAEARLPLLREDSIRVLHNAKRPFTTAKDVLFNKSQLRNLPGFGTKRINVLVEWATAIADKFPAQRMKTALQKNILEALELYMTTENERLRVTEESLHSLKINLYAFLLLPLERLGIVREPSRTGKTEKTRF